MLKRLKKLVSGRARGVRPQLRIVVDDAGASVVDADTQRQLWRIEWAAVKEIVGWKDDVFSYDIMCLGFRTTDADQYYVCDEEYQGWEELTAKVDQVFSLQGSSWWSRVAFPPHARNWTVVWGSPLPMDGVK